jgi:hypothetical protein
VLRQIQAALVNFLYEAGFDYETDIAFLKDGYERGVFFSALTINYLAIVLTASWLGTYLKRQIGWADLVSWVLPVLIMLNHSIVFFGFSGLTEGLSLLMFVVAYLAYRSKSYIVAVLIVLAAAFQRELIAIILFGVVAIDLLAGGVRTDLKGRLAVLAAALLSVATNIALRLRLPSESYSNQVSPASWIGALKSLVGVQKESIFQVFLTQNLAFVTILATILFIFVVRRAPKVQRWLVIDCFVTFAIIFSVGIAASIGNNIARLLIYWTPSLALVLASIMRDWSDTRRDLIPGHTP